MTTPHRIAIVTGASRGIGRGIALELAREGFDVAVNYAGNREAAEETCGLIHGFGRTGIPVQADVSLAQDRERLVAETFDRLGPAELLVNNAGVAPKVRADILDASETSYDDVMDTNLKGPYFLTQHVANRMIQWKNERQIENGRIVFITSISSFAASVNRGEYCLSKAGLSMAVKLFATRLAEEGIGVYEIQPGIIRTDMTAKVVEKYTRMINDEGLLPSARWGTPGDIGRAVASVAAGHFDQSTEISIEVDGGFHLRTL